MSIKLFSLFLPICSLALQAASTPAVNKIAAAEVQIKAHPDQSQPYVDLAMADIRRARETADPAYYAKAEAALQQSFKISAGNYEASKAQVLILLGRHEFEKAIVNAKPLNQKVPDDVLIYGYLAEAYMAMGNYKDAEPAAQWMLDLRAGSVPGLLCAAHLRELFGDADGALELLNMALQRTGWEETEDRAWIFTEMGRLRLAQGKADDAERALQEAQQLFPNYPYAVTALANVRLAQGRPADAAALLKKRYEINPDEETLYALASAMDQAGDPRAAASFAEFETKARKSVDSPMNWNHELVYYYADHAHKPAEALQIARKEFERRHDVYTLDAYAWALHVNGNDKEARKRMDEALAVGIRDASLSYHSDTITTSLAKAK